MTQLLLHFTLLIAVLISAGDSVQVNNGAAAFQQSSMCMDQAPPEQQGSDDTGSFALQSGQIDEHLSTCFSHYLSLFLPRRTADNHAIRAPPIFLS